MSDNDMLFWRMLALIQCVPELSPSSLLAWLAGDSAESLDLAYLEGLDQQRLVDTFPGSPAVMSPARWQRVRGCLRGELPVHLRAVAAPGRRAQLMAAFCSQDGLNINGHFGQCRLFFIYAFDDAGAWLYELRRLPPVPPSQEANEVRAALLSDCHLLFCEAIGGPAAARLIRHHIHPMKVAPGNTISSQREAIQHLLEGKLPPWLAKRLEKANPLADRVF